MPGISVIMPVFNAGEFIGRAIESLLAQSFKDWELIVVDDNSTDCSLSVARYYEEKDCRIRVFESSGHAGNAFPVRERAIGFCRTGIIAPLDADDVVEPEYLRVLYDEFLNTRAQVVYPTMWRMQVDGVVKERLVPGEKFGYDDIWVGRELVAYTLWGWRIGANGGLYDKAFFEECLSKISDKTLMNSDEYFTRLVLLNSSKVKISRAKYYYRENPVSITKKISLKPFDSLVTDKMLQELTLREFGETSDEYIRASMQQFCGVVEKIRYYNAHRTRFTNEERARVLKQLKESRKIINWGIVKRTGGWKLRLLMRPGFMFSVLALRMSERATRRKDND